MNNWHLAVDIGASSGRHILGRISDGNIELKEVYRFSNGYIKKDNHLCWDIESLKENVIKGLKECNKQGCIPVTMGIDTWGVDFVLLDNEDKIIGDAVSYRDSRTEGIKEELEEKGILSFEEHYARTGIQYQQFNTAYQLVALKKEHPEYLEKASAFLMIPDYLNFVLTNKKANEYTDASTTALLNPETLNWDKELMDTLNIKKEMFMDVKQPGESLGYFTDEIISRVGFDCEVILPATHDTGSAYVAVPAKDDDSVFLSSGTWSLLGAENKHPLTNKGSMEANFSNEGGYNYTFRYLKNIMGLWMIQSVRKELIKEWVRDVSFPELIELAKAEKDFDSVVDVDDNRFLAPDSMIKEVIKACEDLNQNVPENYGQVIQCIYNSLVFMYAKSIKNLEKLTGTKYTSINIVGGGSQDMYLNKMTSKLTGLPVYAGPTEATCLGNLIAQFIYSGYYSSLKQARKAVKDSFDIKEINERR